MNGWSRGRMVTAASTAHTARVAAAVEAAGLEVRARSLVALGLARGHFEDGQLCAGHFASDHQDQAAGLVGGQD